MLTQKNTKITIFAVLQNLRGVSVSGVEIMLYPSASL